MVIKDQIYYNTNRNFYTNYVDNLDLTFSITFNNKESNENIIVSGTTSLPNTNNRFFEITIDENEFVEGWYTYTVMLYNIISGEYDEYEKGIAFKEYTEVSTFSDDEGTNNTVFVDND